eukprot:5912113-Amphidinium_carterae.1
MAYACGLALDLAPFLWDFAMMSAAYCVSELLDVSCGKSHKAENFWLSRSLAFAAAKAGCRASRTGSSVTFMDN